MTALAILTLIMADIGLIEVICMRAALGRSAKPWSGAGGLSNSPTVAMTLLPPSILPRRFCGIMRLWCEGCSSACREDLCSARKGRLAPCGMRLADCRNQYPFATQYRTTQTCADRRKRPYCVASGTCRVVCLLLFRPIGETDVPLRFSSHRRVAALIAGTLLASIFLALSPNRAPAQEIGVVKTVEGAVIILRAEAELPALVGRSLQIDDRIIAPADGSVGAILADGTTLAVSGPSDVVVSSYVFDPGQGLFELIIRMLSGRLVYGSGKIGEARPDKVRIETPQLVIGSRGTRFAVVVPEGAQ
ncbi:MAG: FecR domain-containing protein [Pseudomonadota bacterium]